MQNSQVWNFAHIWKTRPTQGNNAAVFVTHVLGGSDHRAGFALYPSTVHLRLIKCYHRLSGSQSPVK